MTEYHYVVDASVVVKCVAEEDQTAEARGLVALAGTERLALSAPELIELEVINVITRDVRRNRIDKVAARAAIHLFRSFSIQQAPMQALLTPAFELGVAHQQSIYDCLYLALALQVGCPLITADRRFYEGVHKAFPMVRLLSAGLIL